MLCDFANQFPAFVADFLGRGRSLKRRFREESVTDMLMASLIPLQGEGIIVEFPDEPRTGADMEWNFVHGDWCGFYRIYIQAKRLYGEGKFWGRHSYKELLHETGNPKQLQAVLLADTARNNGPGCFPLYAFYNPQHSCDLASAAGKQISGVNLADGFVMEALAKTAKSTRDASLNAVHRYLFLLSDVFCPPSSVPIRPMARTGGMMRFVVDWGAQGAKISMTTPPDPQTIRDRLAAQRERVVDLLASDNGYGAEYRNAFLRDLPPVPNVAQSVPSDVRDIIRRSRKDEAGRDAPSLDRWRITFVSRGARTLEVQG